MEWITTHAADTAARLPDVYQQPRLQALAQLVGARAQVVEDALRTLQEGWWLTNAQGAQLDGLGELLGLPRYGAGDAEYLTRLLAFIALVRGSATGDELLALAAQLAPASTWALVEQHPAALELVATGPALSNTPLVYELLQAARAAGVRLLLHSQLQPDAQTFRCGRAVFLTTPVSVGATALATTSTVRFPATGSVVLDEGQATREVLAYSTRGTNSLVLSTPATHTHASHAAVILLNDTSPTRGGFPTSTTLSAAVAARATSLPVRGSARLPASGTVLVEPGTNNELLHYTAKTSTTLTLASAATLDHPARAAVVLQGATSVLPLPSYPPGALSSIR